MTDLDELMQRVVEAYPFTPENYPDLAVLTTDEQRLRFAIKHAMEHVDKAKGVIATQVERGDHGGQMDLVAMQVATAKLLNNTLRLAEVLIMQAWFLGDMALAELKPSK